MGGPDSWGQRPPRDGVDRRDLAGDRLPRQPPRLNDPALGPDCGDDRVRLAAEPGELAMIGIGRVERRDGARLEGGAGDVALALVDAARLVRL